MILRYYHADWSVPCIENELLFVGTMEECAKYLFKQWSVDCKELENNLELKYTLMDYLRHIEIGTIMAPALYTEEIIKRLYETGKGWDDKCEWHHIDASKFIYNQDLIEISPSDGKLSDEDIFVLDNCFNTIQEDWRD